MYYFFHFVTLLLLLSDIFSIRKASCISAYNMYDEFNDKLDKITDLAQEKVRRMSMPTYGNIDKKSNLLKHHLNEIESKSSIDTPADNNKIRKVFNILPPPSYYDRFDEQKPASEHQQTNKIMKDDDDADAENRLPENNIQYSINDNSNLIDNSNEEKIPIDDDERQQHESMPAYVENLKKYSCELCSVDDQQDQRRNCCQSKKIKRETNELNERKSENVQSPTSLSVDDPLKESNNQPSVSKVNAKNCRFEQIK